MKEGTYFKFDSTLKTLCKIPVPQLFKLGWKLRNGDLINFFVGLHINWKFRNSATLNIVLKALIMYPIIVIRLESDTFGNPIFQMVLQN